VPFLALFAALLLLGVADSMVNSYIVLFGADVAGLTPLQIGVWSSVFALAGIVTGWWLGRRFDRRPTRAYAIAVILLGAAGYALLPRVTSFPLLLFMAATVLGALGAAFPQLFTLARAVLGESAEGRRAVPLLRTAWSLAWSVGPLLGALLLSRAGYTGLMWTAAAVFLAAALTVLMIPRPGRVETAGESPGGTPVLLTASMILFFASMFAGGLALPLFVTRALHQQPASVGVLFSVCAGVEVVATLALAVVPARVTLRAVILTGFGALIAYNALTVVSGGMPMLVIAQVLRGAAIAIVGATGIRYFQDLLAPATGRATTLFANAAIAGLLLSGTLAGATIEQFGYETTLLLCGAAAALGALAFALATRHPGKVTMETSRPAPDPAAQPGP